MGYDSRFFPGTATRMQSLQTIADFIRWGASRFNEADLFFGHGTDNAIDEAAVLVLHALHLPPDFPGSWFQSRLTQAEQTDVTLLLQRRIDERLPAAYLTGEAWFAGLRFNVNEHVLVPRSPIAELVEREFEPWIEAGRISRVLDLCCGSGCIGVAAAVYLPDAAVDLADISDQALQVAASNVAEHDLGNRVEVVQSDLFSALEGRQYDVIVCNPPYVSESEMNRLPEEYHREPRLGLTADEEGLALVARILREAPSHLTSWGIIVIEVGSSAETLMARYPEIPFTWLEFERGGDGVFLFTAEELVRYRETF